MNQFSYLHFKDEENKAQDSGQRQREHCEGHSCGLTLYSGRLQTVVYNGTSLITLQVFCIFLNHQALAKFRNCAGSDVSRNLLPGQTEKHWSDLKTVLMTWFPPVPLIWPDWEGVSPWCPDMSPEL